MAMPRRPMTTIRRPIKMDCRPTVIFDCIPSRGRRITAARHPIIATGGGITSGNRGNIATGHHNTATTRRNIIAIRRPTLPDPRPIPTRHASATTIRCPINKQPRPTGWSGLKRYLPPGQGWQGRGYCFSSLSTTRLATSVSGWSGPSTLVHPAKARRARAKASSFRRRFSSVRERL